MTGRHEAPRVPDTTPGYQGQHQGSATSDPGRDALIDARAEKDKLIGALKTCAKGIGVLMEDRVRHMTALRQIAYLTNTGYTITGQEVREIAVRALEAETDMSWWPE